MSPTSSLFLLAETREHPMHVAGLQLFQPPEGADAPDVRTLFENAIANTEIAPLFKKRARRSITTLGQWGWAEDALFDIEHHVRRNALPQPGRILELFTLCSRLHSTLLDRHRPLWEMHLIEGLQDGRFAIYTKAHHALVDGVSALRVMSRMLSEDPDDRNVAPFWAARDRDPRPKPQRDDALPVHALRKAMHTMADAAGIVPAFARTIGRGLDNESGAVSFSAPKTMLNVPITGARRVAAQSWPMERVRRIGKAAEVTVNDVVLGLCSGALRTYLLSQEALPDAPLIAMVPVSLHGEETESGDGGGNLIGLVMCNLATHLDDAADRLAAVHRSMTEGKAALGTMSQLQILAMSAIGVSPLGLYPLLRLDGVARPPFNLVISNVPGPRKPMYWNGARLDGVYPFSIPLDGQALNITVTSYSEEIAFGLTADRRAVPHMQRLLAYLEEELAALERAVGIA